MIDNMSKYIYEVWRFKSISKAAENLFISQPALSASIKKAEQELGFEIFNRKTLPFTLTPEGKIYIDAIEKMLLLEQETKLNIEDIRELKSGTLKIGTSIHIALFAIPIICKYFHKSFPNIDINIITSTTADLTGLLEKKKADLIFSPHSSDLNRFNNEILFEENLIIAVHKDYPKIKNLLDLSLTYEEIINRTYPLKKQITDISIFNDVEFIYNPPKSKLYKKRKMIFGESKEIMYITSPTAHHQLNYNLMKTGFGAMLTTDADIATKAPDKNCVYFCLKTPQAKQNLYIAYSNDDSVTSTKIVENFTKTAKEIFHTENPLKVFLSEY